MINQVLFKRTKVVNALEEVIHNGHIWSLTGTMVYTYLALMLSLGPVEFWPGDLKKFWRKLDREFCNKEKPQWQKKAKILRDIKNKWFSLQGIRFSKKA